jgi:hypothetical protein
MGVRAGQNKRARGKFLCLCRGSNPGRPAVQSVVRRFTDWATPAPICSCTITKRTICPVSKLWRYFSKCDKRLAERPSFHFRQIYWKLLIQKEAAVAQIKALSLKLPGGNEENHKKLGQDRRYPNEDLKSELSKHKSRMPTTLSQRLLTAASRLQ